MANCFSAIAHGCKAARYSDAFKEVYLPRVSRGNEHFVINKLGAFGANLAALAQFFIEPFTKTAGLSETRPRGLSDSDQATMLGLAGFALRAQGRLADAVAPSRSALDKVGAANDWERAATVGGVLSELLLTLGRINEAVDTAQEAIAHSARFSNETRSKQGLGDAKFTRMVAATHYADALAAAGRVTDAAQLFDSAEALQAECQPTLPLHFSQRGYKLCDLRLAQGRSKEVLARAEYMLARTRADAKTPLLTEALEILALGRAHAALATPQLRGKASRYLDEVIVRLRESGAMEFLTVGFLARAEWRRVSGEHRLALEDLKDAFDIADRAGMRLLLADAHIESAHVALAQGNPSAANSRVIQAGKVIDSTYFDHSVTPPRKTEMGYGRRNVDLHLIEAAIALHDDRAAAATALVAATREVEKGYWGYLDKLAALYAQSDLDDGGTIARLTVARAEYNAAADKAFEEARDRTRAARPARDPDIEGLSD
jgi:tetratricopeptide (TPR) repeat protein